MHDHDREDRGTPAPQGYWPCARSGSGFAAGAFGAPPRTLPGGDGGGAGDVRPRLHDETVRADPGRGLDEFDRRVALWLRSGSPQDWSDLAHYALTAPGCAEKLESLARLYGNGGWRRSPDAADGMVGELG